MTNPFLDHEFTQPTELRDFFEWHQGIKHYGFWAIEINHLDCLRYITASKKILADKLHPNYLRQPHITLSASGLIDEKHFTPDVLQQQRQKLEQANLCSFPLYLSSAHSFTTAPYLSIQDPGESLKTIRTLLHSISLGQNATPYVPHVTLGFYDNAYQTSNILKKISAIQFPTTVFSVNEIVFARYNTDEIQGRYQVLHRLPLNPSQEAQKAT